MNRIAFGAAIALATLIGSKPAEAAIKVCITIGETGSAASLGQPSVKSIPFLPKEIAGQPVMYTYFDDASDPTQAARNARKCIEEENADILFGSSSVPTTIAAIGVAAENKRPFISLSPVVVPDASEYWTFQTVQSFDDLAQAVMDQMAKDNVKKLGFIGYSDGYGDLWIQLMEQKLQGTDIKMEPLERFARSDTSVDGQVLKLISSRPDAILVIGSGASAALPNIALKKYGFTGPIYQTSGAVTPEFLRIGGAAVEGTILTTGPVLVADQLNDTHPSKQVGVEYKKAYEDVNGAGTVSAFGGYIYDASLLIQAAAVEAIKKGEPGTEAFRLGLRDALENLHEVVGTHGVYNTTPEKHRGLDSRSVVRITVENGTWKYVE